MEIIYSGGYDKKSQKSIKSSYWYKFSPFLQKFIADGKKVAVVTMAKEDGHYDKFIEEVFNKKPDVISRKSTKVNWSYYSVILFCGGDTPELKKGLLKTGFKVNLLRDDVVIIGDSAGAMIMAPYFYDSDDRVNVKFIKGLYPKSKAIILVHANNPKYAPEVLKDKVREFAIDKDLKLVTLKENESVLLDNENNFYSFQPTDVFGG